MSQFRAAKLDIGCFTKIRNIRDHTKRKVYSENEPERYASVIPAADFTTDSSTAKRFATSSAIPRSRNESARRRSSSCRKCTATHASHRSRTGVSWGAKAAVFSATFDWEEYVDAEVDFEPG